MFGMSFVELSIVAIVALLLLGPDQLPGVARTIGKSLRDLRRASDDLKQTFEQEMVKLETEVNQVPRVPTPPRTQLEAANAVVDVSANKPIEVPTRSESSIASVFALDQARQAQAALPPAPGAAPVDPGALRAQARAAAAPLDPGAARAAARFGASVPPPRPFVRSNHFDSVSVVADEQGNLPAAAPAVPAVPAVDAAPSVDAAPAVPAAPAVAAPAIPATSALAAEDEFKPLRADSGPAVVAPKAPPSGSVPREKKSDAS